ncbi:histidine kinase N-terminal 7TM domain-containing protein [Haloarchaeobius amylolyticus]|uniref:histidine kinase N-terminal 7TM domain-containing protein n=1 Tax=Haloarchaeobius amylolyticus TaxID=1198296 RepID=UPI00227178A8|nr:histidine kinase N-terminal 7TM domain-containing protein [Haloarchaeobius amylolyticus]
MSLLLVTAVLAAFAAFCAHKQRPKPGATWLTLLLAGVAWWAAFYAVELPVAPLAARRPFMKLQWLGSLTIPVFWVLFALEYTGRDQWVSRRTAASLLVVPTIVAGFVFTFEHHDLLYQSVDLVPAGDLYAVEHVFGPVFYLGIGYSYLLTLVGSAVFVALLVGRSPTHRQQSLALLVAIVAPWVSNLVYVFDVRLPVNVDPTPVAFLVTGIASYLALQQLELFEAVPVPDRIARDFVVDGMYDPVVVVDNRDRIVDMNPAAESVVGFSIETALGRDATDTVPGFPAGTGDGETVTVSPEGRVRHFDVRVSAIEDTHDRRLGQVVTMRDVTKREHDEQRLNVLNRVLRHNLRNEMQVVSGCAEELEGRLDDETDISLARTIHESAREVASLGDTAREIEDMLDSPENAPTVDLRPVLDQLLDRAGSSYPGAVFTLQWNPSSAIYCRRPIKPVLQHLLTAAASTGAPANPQVQVFVHADSEDHVSITVADDGPPISAAERAVLETGTETPLDHASGLDLWLVVWGTRAMGGSLDFESHRETGNAVTVHVPVVESVPRDEHPADVDS